MKIFSKIILLIVISTTLFSGCYNFLDVESYKSVIPRDYSFFKFDSVIFKSNLNNSYTFKNLPLIIDDFEIDYKTNKRFWGGGLNIKKVKYYYQYKSLYYCFTNDTMWLTQRYNSDYEKIKNELELNYKDATGLIFTDTTNEVIGDYQIQNIIYKDVVKITKCGVFDNVYANYYWGILEFTLNEETFQVLNFFY